MNANTASTKQKQIAAMIEEIETYRRCHPFWAISSDRTTNENLVEIYNFSMGEMALNPSLPMASERFQKSLETIGEKLPMEDKEATDALYAIDSLCTEIAKGCERVGYYMGVGCKTDGCFSRSIRTARPRIRKTP